MPLVRGSQFSQSEIHSQKQRCNLKTQRATPHKRMLCDLCPELGLTREERGEFAQ